MKQNRFEEHPVKIYLGVFVVFLFVAVAGTEVFLSLSEKDNNVNTIIRHIRLKEHSPSFVRYVVPNDAYMTNTDSLIQKEFKFEVDDDGYIYPSRVHEIPDVTILFLGGSTTENIYVEEQNRFPYLAGKLLEKDGKKINSVNSGVSGNSSMHSINILLNKGLALKPDIAVLMHTINDLVTLLYEKNYWNTNPSRSLLVSSQTQQDADFHYIRNVIRASLPRIYERLRVLKNKYLREGHARGDEFAHMRGKRLTINKHEIVDKFENSLLTFIFVCKSNGIMPVLMTQPSRFKEEPDMIIIDTWAHKLGAGIIYKEYKDTYDAMNDKIRELGKTNKTLVIDLARHVPQESAYMYDSVHFNDAGSRYVATLIANQLDQFVTMPKRVQIN